MIIELLQTVAILLLAIAQALTYVLMARNKDLILRLDAMVAAAFVKLGFEKKKDAI